ncbi:MAG: GNAT family N-acetyltransferase [Candidatus Bipolaricaulota bacterium]|nr:GNAT family N-acetyltransferase [Candidatus Bipolaricaulota bacterium]
MEWTRGDYRISTDKSFLSVEKIHALLLRSYWASRRPRETIRRSIEGSLCYGLYWRDEQIGFARVVTDYATFYWLCDVFIEEDHRGHGLGKWLVRCVVETPELAKLLGVLATRDALGLYAPYGFSPPEAAGTLLWRRPTRQPDETDPGGDQDEKGHRQPLHGGNAVRPLPRDGPEEGTPAAPA